MANALLIVDYQNDFARPDGALSVAGGGDIAERINELARSGKFDHVIATRDWHPRDHGSFEERGGPWPPHCVQGTEGAELYAELDREPIETLVDKGQDPSTDGYTSFDASGLEQMLRDLDIDHVTIVGLATDYCVKNTALDAVRLGFDVTVDTSAVRAVEVEPGDGERALDEMRSAGATIA